MDEYFPASDPIPPLAPRSQDEPVTSHGSRRLLPFAIVAGALAIAAGGYLAGHVAAGTNVSGPSVAAAAAASASDLSATDQAALTAAPASGAQCQFNGRGVAGTLKSVNGSSLSVTDASGKPIAVTTSPSTKIQKTLAGSVSDISNGSVVVVRGTSSGQNAISADQVSILPASAAQKLSEAGAAAGHFANRAPAAGFAVGTVSKAANGSVTVTEPGGTAVTVTTSTSTKVVKTVDATVNDLTKGQPIVVQGTANADGSIAAARIFQGTETLGLGHGFPGGFGPGGFRHAGTPGTPGAGAGTAAAPSTVN